MVRLENVSKIYRIRDGEVRALDDVSFSVKEGEFVVVRGPSGSGKSTLLLTIGGMIHPTKGRVLVKGEDLYAMGGQKRAKFRAENIGFIFQMFHLIPYLDIVENVLLSASVVKRRVDPSDARDLLTRLRLSGREHHKPSELSTGERQRTAVARALLNRPKIILADEPTGNLDPDNAAEVMGYLSEFHSQGGTVVVVTHDDMAESYAERTVLLREGSIELL